MKRVGINVIPEICGDFKSTMLGAITMNDVEKLRESEAGTGVVSIVCGRYGSDDKKTVYGNMREDVYTELKKLFPRKVGAAVSILLKTKK